MENSSFSTISGMANCSRYVTAINLLLVILPLATTGTAEANNATNPVSEMAASCSDTWYRSIEEKIPTGDKHGHGPDIGSDEWKSVVEFKLSIRGKPDVPAHNSKNWCRYIDQLVRANHNPSTTNTNAIPKGATPSPSFDCNKTLNGSIEAMICGDEGLSALDRKLSDVYDAALKKAENQHPPFLKAEQRGWIKGRDECWKAADKHACVKNTYKRRTAELQAEYRLVSHVAPVRFICSGNPANEVIATFFDTDPPTLIVERGDSTSLMYLQPSGSGSKYHGRNETFWEHQGQALITWGYEADEMRCVRALN